MPALAEQEDRYQYHLHRRADERPSTVLRVVSGLHQAQRWRVTLGDTTLSSMPAEILRHGVAQGTAVPFAVPAE